MAGSASVRGLARVALVLGALALSACSPTTDSLGYDETASLTLTPLTPLSSYPNPFRDLLGQTPAAITAKIANAFNTIFHGDPSTQAIYVPVGTNQAYIQDVLHNDIRTEGIGLAMMVCVQVNKQDEFDKLWTYAKAVLEIQSGANAGYFPSFCDGADGTPAPCLDPYGFQQFVMALILAHDRWNDTSGANDYGADALALFHTLRHKEDDNGGVVDGVTNTFDPIANLPLDVPNVSAAGVTRPSIVMPGYYTLWAQAAADPTWTATAAAGRAFLPTSANATTGLTPVRSAFDGTPSPGWATFLPEGYRTQINLVIDQIWTSGSAWNVTENNQLLAFFSAQGINTYGTSYTLDGAVTNPAREPSLVVANGIAAAISTNADRASYVNAVWNMDPPIGQARYYVGILQLVALLILGGQFQIY
ncbi:MAG TPA: glycosyl hydrolase family 8 [Polyangia bacterium]|nr:glycosyl hydrolase family 8 [Polyangia bacterium]